MISLLVPAFAGRFVNVVQFVAVSELMAWSRYGLFV